MPYITETGYIYNGQRQRKNHVEIPNPPNNHCKFNTDTMEWEEDPNASAFINKKVLLSELRGSTVEYSGITVEASPTMYIILKAKYAACDTNTSIIDKKGYSHSITKSDLEDILTAIENKIEEVWS